jgi:riboflavin kinase/FMN adenylyltransferase
VIKGDGLGHQLGFPTANLDATGLVLPPNGVYAAHAEFQGRTHRAVLNLGYRPTLNNPAPLLRVEVHVLDFIGNLYDETLKITFVEKLREEKKFASLSELREQIAKDIAVAREEF